MGALATDFVLVQISRELRFVSCVSLCECVFVFVLCVGRSHPPLHSDGTVCIITRSLPNGDELVPKKKDFVRCVSIAVRGCSPYVLTFLIMCMIVFRLFVCVLSRLVAAWKRADGCLSCCRKIRRAHVLSQFNRCAFVFSVAREALLCMTDDACRWSMEAKYRKRHSKPPKDV